MDRYSRQKLFAPIGVLGQQTLHQRHALIVGMGALGSAIAEQLARSGIGALTIIDRDVVEWSNLQRQSLYDEADAAASLPKAIAAERKLRKMNSELRLEAIVTDVTASNVEEWVRRVDLVLDGTDNFFTRFLLNDACFRHHVPFIYGGAVGSQGMSAPFIPGLTPCFRCIVPSAHTTGPTCDTVGVIAPIVTIVASYQVTEAMKWLTGNQAAIRKSLITMDVWKSTFFEIQFDHPNGDCPVCIHGDFPALQPSEAELATSLCGRDTVQITRPGTLDLDVWEQKLSSIGKVMRNPFLLKIELDEHLRFVLFKDGRILVQGTSDIIEAKTAYAKYFGIV